MRRLPALLLVLPLALACGRRESARRPPDPAAESRRPDAATPSDAPSAAEASPAEAHARGADAVAGHPVDRTPQCLRGDLPSDVPALPDGVLLQSLVASGAGLQAGLRIYDDGRYESKSVGQDWAGGQTLAPEKLQEVRQGIAAARLARVAGGYRAVAPRPQMSVNWLEVRDAGGVVVVAADDACFVPEVDALLAGLVELFD
jgi:hypothetical protein